MATKRQPCNKIIKTEVEQYLKDLKSRQALPSSGTTSAISGAQGLALVIRVCEHTIGKVNYEEYQETCLKCRDRAEGLFMEMLELVDEDTEAYGVLNAARQLPCVTEEEKEARKIAVADAVRIATAIPYRVMELSIEGMKLAEELFDSSNPNSRATLGIAAINLMTGAQGAWLNVKTNLPGVTDEGMARAFREDGRKMYDLSEMLSIRLYDAVAKSLEE